MSTCRVCGCSDFDACWDPVTDLPCRWVEDDLCSICAELPALSTTAAAILL